MREKYKNAEILALLNSGGLQEDIIIDNNIQKSVYLSDSPKFWESTIFAIKKETITSYLYDELRQNVEFDISEVFKAEYAETPDGDYYIIWVGNIGH